MDAGVFLIAAGFTGTELLVSYLACAFVKFVFNQQLVYELEIFTA